MESFSWILDFGIADALDMLFTATLIDALLLGLRKTKASFVFGGMLF